MDLLAAPSIATRKPCHFGAEDSPEKYREPDLSQPGSSCEKENRAAIRIPVCYCDMDGNWRIKSK
jgi:hypothetical protein